MSTGDERAKAQDEARNAARDEARRALAANWDRVGRYLQNGGDVGAKIVKRNLDAWSGVSRKLNSGGYDRHDLVTDAMNLLVTVTRNAEDIWRGMTAPAGNDNVAMPVPTVFLYFRRNTDGTHELVDPVMIPVRGAADRVLPDRAEIALSGTAVDKATADDVTGVDALRHVLSVRARPAQPGVFLVEAVANPTNNLIGGTYDGFVYIAGEYPCPLAELRVVVEADTADSPQV
jgi:hypothetical protein